MQQIKILNLPLQCQKVNWIFDERIIRLIKYLFKKLKEYNENLIRADKKKTKHIDELEEENKKLNKRIAWYEKEEARLREENKKLKSDLAFERTMLDNVRAEYKSLQNVNKKLKEELSKYKKQYEHSMWEDDELIYEEWLYD